jgi:putative transposase
MFRTPSEHELFLELYARTAKKRGWLTLAWALVWNHHHFLVALTDGGLSDGMRVIHSGFSRRMHAKYDRTGTGHFVRHCFYAGQLKTDGSVLEVARYIDLNAVRAGLCRSPRDWKWSSYRANVGLAHPRTFHQPHELLEFVAARPRVAQREYRQFVTEGLAADSQVLDSEQGHEAGTGPLMLESAG